LDESLDYERQMMELTGSTEDHRSAVASFLAKEKPTFHGR
jgi:2-(1,2-epoxy-1,2-dihydrophenyl)acetyl-CoA isomerase